MWYVIAAAVIVVILIVFVGLPALQRMGYRGNRENLRAKVKGDLRHASKVAIHAQNEFEAGERRVDVFWVRWKEIVDAETESRKFAIDLLMDDLPELTDAIAAFEVQKSRVLEYLFRADEETGTGTLRQRFMDRLPGLVQEREDELLEYKMRKHLGPNYR